MEWEKYGYPLIVAGSLAGIYMLFRRSDVGLANPASQVGVVGIDPGSRYGTADPQIDEYIARVPGYALQPAYVRRALSMPLATQPWSNDPYGENSPAYISENQGAPQTPYGLPASNGATAGACGCGGSCGGCESKCGAGNCDYRAPFADSRGTCLQPETNLPGRPLDIMYYSIQAAGGPGVEP